VYAFDSIRRQTTDGRARDRVGAGVDGRERERGRGSSSVRGVDSNERAVARSSKRRCRSSSFIIVAQRVFESI